MNKTLGLSFLAHFVQQAMDYISTNVNGDKLFRHHRQTTSGRERTANYAVLPKVDRL